MNSKTKVEILFIGIVLILLASAATYNVYGILGHERNIPQDTYDPSLYVNTTTINVTGVQWSWSFELPNMTAPSTHVYLEKGTSYTLNVTSGDVIHDLFIIGAGVQVYAVPGQYNHVVFTPEKTGKIYYECVEYCGEDHYEMRGYFTVLPANSTSGGS
ncbi:MAG: cytochrome c oxidase subunit II [Thermoplasmataceae archaeon]|jgi:heme/copper-type cytochrome/quinol oxidase subunit 2